VRLERQVSEEEAKRPLPLPRAAARPAPPPAAPSADLEAAIRAAVEAEEVAPAPPPDPPPLPPRPAAPKAVPRATAPAKLKLDTTIKTALTQQSALKKKTAPGRPAPPRTRVAWLILFAVVAFGGAGRDLRGR
jgi:hypothetical protein